LLGKPLALIPKSGLRAAVIKIADRIFYRCFMRPVYRPDAIGVLIMSSAWARPVELVSQLTCVAAVIAIGSIYASTSATLDPNGDVTGLLCSAFGMLVIAIFARVHMGRIRIVSLGMSFALFTIISLLATVASAAVAVGGTSYVDSTLAAADSYIAPWYDWPGVARGLPWHSNLQWGLGELYVSLNWQPVLLFAAVAIGMIDTGALDRIVAAWGLSLSMTIASFHWLPAEGAYLYYGIRRADLPGMRLDLPWRYPEALARLRGNHPSIDSSTMIGIVTVPSFHACAAVLLAWAFAHNRLMRWPMVMLNAGMAVSAVTMGGHYLIDIVTGVAVALVSIAIVCALDGEPVRPLPFRRRIHTDRTSLPV